MANVVLFHSALGLRPAVLEWAQILRERGHTVHTPDLYDGAVFDDLADGERKRDELGVAELMGRAAAAADQLPAELVFAGFSMGAAAAQFLAATRAGARGALLMHGAVPLAAFGAESWPPGVAVQVHRAAADGWADAEAIESVADAARAAGAPAEVFVYPGSGHLFADPGLPDHDAASAALMLDRAAEFIAARGAPSR